MFPSTKAVLLVASVLGGDPRQVYPARITAHLTRLTGFGATILPDPITRR